MVIFMLFLFPLFVFFLIMVNNICVGVLISFFLTHRYLIFLTKLSRDIESKVFCLISTRHFFCTLQLRGGLIQEWLYYRYLLVPAWAFWRLTEPSLPPQVIHSPSTWCAWTIQTRDPRIVQSFKSKCKIAPVYFNIAVQVVRGYFEYLIIGC